VKVHLVSARFTNYRWGFGNDVFDALIDAGHTVIDTDYRLDGPAIAERLKLPCDLLLALKAEGIPPEAIRACPAFTVLWYPDDLIALEHAAKQIDYNGRAFDRVYGISKWDLGEYKKRGLRDVRWLPLACNPEIHKKLRRVRKRYDLVFVGNLDEQREVLIERLRKRWWVHVARAFGADMVRLFNEARIVLNLTAGPGNMNHRLFEALACGSMLLTNQPPPDSRIFKDGKHLVYYTWANIDEKIGYYLAHEKERERIARAGRREVLAKHTVAHRVERIIKEMEQ